MFLIIKAESLAFWSSCSGLRSLSRPSRNSGGAASRNRPELDRHEVKYARAACPLLRVARRVLSGVAVPGPVLHGQGPDLQGRVHDVAKVVTCRFDVHPRGSPPGGGFFSRPWNRHDPRLLREQPLPSPRPTQSNPPREGFEPSTRRLTARGLVQFEFRLNHRTS
jgi:hypothetical protein